MFIPRHRAILLCALSGLIFCVAPAWAAERARAAEVQAIDAGSAATDQQRLQDFLGADGRLDIPADFSGTIDPTGFELLTTAGGAPRFQPKATAAIDDADHWSDAFADPGGGCAGTILAIAKAADGTLYLGGQFNRCTDVSANNVVRWDPATGRYSTLGAGASNGVDAIVYSIAIVGSNVIVGGDFASAGGAAARRVAAWNGSTWSTLGAGAGNGTNGTVAALAVQGSVVYVGGTFSSAGGVAANNLARWDGSAWSTVGAGASNGVNDSVSALAVSGTSLIAGGAFTSAGGTTANRIARWNGSVWSSFGSGAADGVDGNVRAVAVAANGVDVYAGGDFFNAGGATAYKIARWDGSAWSAVGASLFSIGGEAVYAIAVSGSDLYVGGDFLQAGSQVVNYVARWDGTNWNALGNGASAGVGSQARALLADGSSLYAVGLFATAGLNGANRAARWNGTAWSALVPPGAHGLPAASSVTAMSVAGSLVYVAGAFTQIDGITANGIAKWDGSAWTSLGTGSANGVTGVIHAIAVAGSDVYVGGYLSKAGGQPTQCVARWNGSAWSGLAQYCRDSGGGDGDVRAILVSGSDLYVGGNFVQIQNASAVYASYVARLSGGSWSSLNGQAFSGTDAPVNALVKLGSDIFVGGEFTSVAGFTANHIARWNGVAWSALMDGASNGVAGTVLTLTPFSVGIVAGGEFLQAGPVTANHVAYWSGSSWSSFGSGANAGTDGTVFSVFGTASDLFAAGEFATAGGVVSGNVARWNGSAWQSLGSGAANGTDGRIVSLAMNPAQWTLFVGGDFSMAGGKLANRLSSFDVRRNIAVTLASGTNPTVANSNPVLTASLASGGFPASPGTVQFFDGTTPIANCSAIALTGSLDTRTARCDVTSLTVGSHSISARYSGDISNFTSSGGSLNQVVTAPVLTIAPASLPNGYAGVSYNQTLSFSGAGATAPTSFSVSANSPPTGLTLSPGGQLSGVPTTPNTYPFSVTLVDSSTTSASGGPFSATVAYSITISLQSTAIAIGSISPEPSLTGQTYSVPVTVSGQFATPSGIVNCSDGSGATDARALSGGTATCQLTSATPGTKTITVTYAGNATFDASVQTKPHEVNNANQAPTLGYAPGTGTTVGLTGAATQLGDPASGQVVVTVTGAGTGTGNVSLGCSASGGNFQIGSGANQSLNLGDTPAPIALACTRTASVQAGTLNCTETSTPGGAQRQLSWPLSCPAASAVPPTLSYDPTPGNAVVFPGGAANTPSNAAIQVTSAGAVGNGSTMLSCSIPPSDTAFSIVGGNNQTVTGSVGAVPLALRCNLSAIARSSTLSCTETDGPVVAQRSRSWPLNCPAGQAATTAKLTVGSRTGTRGQTVAVPVSFIGEGSTYSVSAQLSFDNSRLTLRKLSNVGTGQCTPVNDGQGRAYAVNVAIPNLGGALPAADTRYCELDLQVAANAPNGAVALSIGQANCLDAAQASRLCAKTDGRVAVAAIDPAPGDGAAITISGHVSDVDASYALFVTNRGVANQTITNCALTSASPALVLLPSPVFPLTLTPQQRATLTLGCHLPPLGETLAGTLTCSTDDPMRGLMSYAVVCRTVADGEALPADQLLNAQQRAGEQQGRSAAMARANGTTFVALGAPFGGGDGNGRVALYESVVTAAKSGGDGRRALRALASLEAPRAGAPGRAKALAALVTEGLGQAVALRSDGGEVAIGAPSAPVSLGGAAGPGRVYRYVRPAAGWESFDAAFDTPVILEAPTIPGIASAGFGASLVYSASGDLLVGAPASTASSVSGAGAVFAYVSAGLCPAGGVDPRDGSACTPGASLFELPVASTSTAAVGNGNFGAALAAASNAVFVGAPGELASAIRPGNVYRVGYVAGTFTAPIRLAPTSAQATNDRFGSALAISGDLLFAGAPGADTAGSDAGAVLVFKGLVAPLQVSTLLPAAGPSQAAGSALAANASVLYVGAPSYSSASLSGVGRVYVYPVKASYAVTETPASTIDNATGQPNDDYGRAIALGPDQAVIGVPRADETLFDGTPLSDTGRADPFVFPKGDAVFGDGFE